MGSRDDPDPVQKSSLAVIVCDHSVSKPPRPGGGLPVVLVVAGARAEGGGGGGVYYLEFLAPSGHMSQIA